MSFSELLSKGVRFVYQIKNKADYLGFAFIVSSIHMFIYCVPVAGCLIAITVSSAGFPFEFFLENYLLTIYMIVSMVSSALYLTKSKSLSIENFQLAFKYSFLPVLSAALLVLCIFILNVVYFLSRV